MTRRAPVVLSVLAHPDDAEILCAGTLLRLAAAGCELHIATFTAGDCGSMELAPLVGLADAIVDLVSTGNTLRANGLVEVEPIADISARLVVNQASYKRKRIQLQPIFDLLK